MVNFDLKRNLEILVINFLEYFVLYFFKICLVIVGFLIIMKLCGLVVSLYMGLFFIIYLKSGRNNVFLSKFFIFLSFVFVIGILDVFGFFLRFIILVS